MKHIFLSTVLILASFTMMNCTTKEQTSANDADNGNAAIENIMTRTSIRAFTGQSVSSDTVEMLLRAGMAAPTAVNLQPWHFVAVTDRAKLDEMRQANPHAKMLEQAPLAIVVCGDMNKAMEGPGRDFWIQDCSAATENILLAAHALGLGAFGLADTPLRSGLTPSAKSCNCRRT